MLNVSKNLPGKINFLFFLVFLFFSLQIKWNPPVWNHFPDAWDYLKQSHIPLASKEFFLPHRTPTFYTRPLTVPLLYKLASGNPDRIIQMQLIIHALSAFFLVFSLLLFIRRKYIKYLLIFFIYALFSWWNMMGWSIALLSESLSFSFMFLWIASFLIFYKKKNKFSLIAHIIITIFFSFTRDNWPYVLISFYWVLLFYALLWDKLLMKRCLLLLMFSFGIFFIQNYSARIGQRHLFQVLDNIVLNILPNDEYLQWFENHGMPGAGKLKKNYSGITFRDKKIYSLYKDTSYSELVNWIDSEGQQTYLKFLISHPGYTFLLHEGSEKIERIFELNQKYYTGNPRIHRWTTFTVFPLFNLLFIFCFGLILLYFFFQDKNFIFLFPAILIFVFTVNALVSYHADAMEVERHESATNIMIQFIGILLVTLILDSESIRQKIKTGRIKFLALRNSVLQNKQFIFILEKTHVIKYFSSMKNQLSSVAIAIVVLASLCIDFSLKNWEKRDRVIEWDIHSHYAYLPAKFVYDDIRLLKDDYRFAKDYYLFWPNTTPEGKKVIKTSMGMSILYAPFFFVAHAFAHLTNYPENGFSEPYKLFLLLSAVFYLFVGLIFLRKLLRHYNFSENIIAGTLLLVGLGTNLLCYASQSAPMPHVYIFCLVAIFIYYTIKWHEVQSAKNTIIIGLLLGLLTLIRPTNAIFVIVFSLIGVSNFSELKQRMLFFKREWFLINVIFFFALLVWIPQFIYWKITSGSYLYYSYTGERFFFNDPKILEGLFGFRKGWLLYTPMMLFALAGIFFLNDDRLKKLRWSIILFFAVNVYVIFSWWSWWYGGTYGQRSMIDSYALLAIPFASFIQHVSGKTRIFKIIFYCIALFFIWLNIFQTYQFEYYSLHWDGMTKELYFKQFGKLDKIKDFDNYVNSPNYEDAMKGKRKEYYPDEKKVKPPVKPIINKNVVSSNQVHLRAFNNKYVCADESLENLVYVNRNDASVWETFTLIRFENNACALRAHSDLYLSAELGNQSEIAATSEEVGSRETFSIYQLDSSMVAFKATNGKYLGVDEVSHQLFAKSDSISRREKFRLIDAIRH